MRNKNMQHDPDYHMALLLQQQFNTEYNVERPSQDLTYNKKKKKNSHQSLTDPSWELVDPTPNIFLLFVQFNERFFWNKLGSVAVSWSKRMTSCAGICSYQGRGGLCHITLSEPLLKLRPRKDLVETLLHEMIHALLFVTHNNKDRDGHGPEFHKHMYRINGEAGTNITVYHDFHDEVRLYKQHWWRCDGPCQKRPPFFGMVRRAMNRAPGPYDRWWAQHQQTCGGNFIKVKEPEKKEKNNNKTISNSNKNTKLNSPKKNSPNKNLPDIRNFLPVVKTTSSDKVNNTINTTKSTGGLGTKNKNGTVVLNPKNSSKGNDLSVSSVIPNSSNIVGFTKSENKIPVKNIEIFAGEGKKLSETPTSSTNLDYNTVRNHWANKFSNPGPSNIQNNAKRKSLNFDSENNKKIKKNLDSNKISNATCPNCNKLFNLNEIDSHIDSCLNADESIKSEFSNESLNMVECPVCQIIIDEDILNEHLDTCLNKENIDMDSDNLKDCTEPDKTRCEICESFIPSAQYTFHIQDCLNKCYDNIEQDLKINTKPTSDTILCLVCNKNIVKDQLNDHLEDCMVSVFDKDNFKDDIEEEDDNDDKESDQLNKSIYNCPICMDKVDETDMNAHIDECLNAQALKNEFS